MKKIISLVLVLVLALTAIGGTLAYFTDTDQAENVFTVGNVDIALREYGVIDGAGASDEDYREALKEYQAMPGVAVDKEVWVENNGSQAAYIQVVIEIDKDLIPTWRNAWENDWDWSQEEKDDVVIHTFRLKNPLNAEDETDLLLTDLTLNPEITNLTVDAGYNVPINVYAIQAAGFGSAADAYAALTEALGSTVEVTNQAGLNDAIAGATAGEQVILDLDAGTYTLPQIGSAQAPESKEIIVTGTKDTVIDMSKAVQTADCDLMFDGVTIDFNNTTNYIGLQHANKVVYRNCTILGQLTNYAPDVQFIGCTFENKEGYNVWTYGANNATFTDCTFTTGGRAILVYNEQTNSNFVANVTLTNCTFSDDGTYTKGAKAAVETGVADVTADGGDGTAKNTATSNTYNLTFTNCSVSGFEVNNSSDALWGNKNKMDDTHLNVIIDAVVKY